MIYEEYLRATQGKKLPERGRVDGLVDRAIQEAADLARKLELEETEKNTLEGDPRYVGPHYSYVVPTLFSGIPKPRQTCECSKCGRVAVVVCGTCDEVKP